MGSHVFVALLFFCASSLPWITTQQQDAGILDSKILHQLLDKYDGSNRPANQSKEAVVVTVNFYLRDIFFQPDTEEVVGVQITFRERWNDPRLKFSNEGVKYLSIRDTKRLWVPDLFFSNSKQGYFHELMEPNILMRIFPNGDVLYSRRVTLSARCVSDWAFYPLNRIKCPVIVASYGYTTEDVELVWKSGDPIQVAKAIMTRGAKFKLQKFSHNICTSKTITGEYGCLVADFVMRRSFAPFFMFFYGPSILAVLVAWLSFWVDKKLSPSLSLTVLVASLIMSCAVWLYSVGASPASYVITGANVYTAMGVAFSLYAVLHFYLTNATTCTLRKLCRSKKAVTYNEDAAAVPLKKILAEEDLEKNNAEEGKKQQGAFTNSQICHMVSHSNKADLIAKVLYPSLYLVFNIIYWAVYNEKDHF